MSLYNNVIRNLEREEAKDENKIGYETWETLYNLPGIKQTLNWFEESARKGQILSEYQRSEENKNLLTKGLAWTSFGLEQIVGLPFRALDTGLEAISDRTNLDKRTLYLGLDIALAGTQVKGSKSGAYNRGFQTRQYLDKNLNKFSNYWKPASRQTVDIPYTSSMVDDIFKMNVVDFNLAKQFTHLSSSKYWYSDGDLNLPKWSMTDPLRDDSTKFLFREYSFNPDQGSFKFGDNGEIYWNRIDPASKEAWKIWLRGIAQDSGYATTQDMIKIMRNWPEPKYQAFLRELWDGSREGESGFFNRFNHTGYAEHKIAKASKKLRLEQLRRKFPDLSERELQTMLTQKSEKTFDMDWLHDTEWIDNTGLLRTDGIGLGDRNRWQNMLALFNTRFKSFKDVSEQIGYGSELEPGPLVSYDDGTFRDPKNRFYIDVEDPGKKRKQYLRQNPGDLIIRRADNHKIIGNLGAYLDALYPMDDSLRNRLEVGVFRSINPETGLYFKSLAEFRQFIIKNRIKTILADTALLPSDTTKRKLFIKEMIQRDMVDLFEEYPFLQPTQTLADEIATDEAMSEEGWIKRSQTPKNLNIGETKARRNISPAKPATDNWIQKLIDGIIPDDR